MSRPSISDRAREVVEPVIEGLGYEVVDVQYVKEGAHWILRITIDHPDGIGLDDCSQVSTAIDAPLDEADPIPGPYSLEVSSPGLDRPLYKPEHFERFAGSEVNVRTYAPIDGRKNWRGILVGLQSNELVLMVDGTEVRLPFDKVSRTRLVPNI